MNTAHNEHLDDDRDIIVPPSPRRSDDAFARAVAADVDAARSNRLNLRRAFGVPALAVAGAAFAVMITVMPSTSPTTAPTTATTTTAPTAPTTIAMAMPAGAAEIADDLDVDDADLAAVIDDADDDVLLALVDTAGISADGAADFSFDALDGSTEQELEAIAAALDAATRQL